MTGGGGGDDGLHIASHRMHHCHIHCINMLWALCEINWPYSWHAQSEKRAGGGEGMVKRLPRLLLHD